MLIMEEYSKGVVRVCFSRRYTVRHFRLAADMVYEAFKQAGPITQIVIDLSSAETPRGELAQLHDVFVAEAANRGITLPPALAYVATNPSVIEALRQTTTGTVTIVSSIGALEARRNPETNDGGNP